MTGFSGHFSFSAVIYLKAVIIHFKNLKNSSEKIIIKKYFGEILENLGE